MVKFQNLVLMSLFHILSFSIPLTSTVVLIDDTDSFEIDNFTDKSACFIDIVLAIIYAITPRRIAEFGGPDFTILHSLEEATDEECVIDAFHSFQADSMINLQEHKQPSSLKTNISRNDIWGSAHLLSDGAYDLIFIDICESKTSKSIHRLLFPQL
jgi:hypothetical protein